MERIRNHALVPKSNPIHGFIYDVGSGQARRPRVKRRKQYSAQIYEEGICPGVQLPWEWSSDS